MMGEYFLKREGIKLKHRYDRTRRTCFLPYYKTKHLNDIEASNIEPSFASNDEEEADLLPPALVREIQSLADTFEEFVPAQKNKASLTDICCSGGSFVIPAFSHR